MESDVAWYITDHKDKYIKISYETYNKKTKKNEIYQTCIPKKLKLNENFLYLLGLMYGDGTSGSRVGVVNKNPEIIKNSALILKKSSQKER